jgi:hypothetical protein
VVGSAGSSAADDPGTGTDPPGGASPGAGAHWDDVYRTGQPKLSWHQPSLATSLRLIGPRPGPDSRAVDVGGGTSTLVDVLLRDGWTVAVLDVSAEALAVSGRRLGAWAAPGCPPSGGRPSSWPGSSRPASRSSTPRPRRPPGGAVQPFTWVRLRRR